MILARRMGFFLADQVVGLFYAMRCNAVRTAVRTRQENNATSRMNAQHAGGGGGTREMLFLVQAP